VLLGLAGLTGVVVLAVAWSRLGGQEPFLYRGGFAVCGLAAIAVIATVAHPEAGLISRALSFRPLCMLGWISYGVYLWHWPVYVVLDPVRTGIDAWPLLVLRIAVTLVIAIASYVFLEQPIRHGAGTSTLWRVLTPAAAVVLVAVVVGTTTGATEPRIEAVGSRVSTQRAANEAARTPGAQRIMVVGNSVGYFLGRALAQIPSPAPKVVLDGALPACVFPSSAESMRYGDSVTHRDVRDCDTRWTGQLRTFRPDTVLFVYGEPGQADYRYGGRWLTPCSHGYDSLFRRSLESMIRRFQRTGAHVVVSTVAYASIAAAIPKVAASWLRATDCSNRVRREAARATGAQIVDLFRYTCPHGTCRNTVDGAVLRTDGIHYRDEGARIVARWILRQLPHRASAGSS
jgi:lysophospholipase L1-like esterase